MEIPLKQRKLATRWALDNFLKREDLQKVRLLGGSYAERAEKVTRRF
jgi:hypothetical protein